jgi:translation initiation factor 3 subunit E
MREQCSDNGKDLSALWGKFACDILLNRWDVALEDVTSLRELIESNQSGSPVFQLQERAWLIHWSLFVFFGHPKAS